MRYLLIPVIIYAIFMGGFYTAKQHKDHTELVVVQSNTCGPESPQTSAKYFGAQRDLIAAAIPASATRARR